MDLWDLTKMLFRRWYVFAPVLLASLAGVFVVSQNVQPDYSAVGHLQLIPPPERKAPSPGANAPKPNNRWLDLGFPALGSAVILQAQSEEVLSQLTAAGYTDNFTVTMEYGTTYLTIEAIGTSRVQATSTVQRLMKVLDQLVLTLQEQFDAPKQDQITTLALDNGDKVEAVTSKKKRVAIVAFGLALMLSVGASIGLDALLRMRRRGTERAADEADEPVFTATVPAQRTGSVSPPPAVDSTVVLRLPSASARAETGTRADRGGRGREETARIYPAGHPHAPQAEDKGRHGEASARAEIAARAEAATRGEGGEAGTRNGSDRNGTANGRSGVVVSRSARPAADNIDATIILPVPRGAREDKS
ncbi:hypothetical protein Asp14428_11950 [Actinoplanes sp. NBRC 14428]|nr:hypothetical protein Asp14428_11950 [Actinoplanes sp. NBRC 14428]